MKTKCLKRCSDGQVNIPSVENPTGGYQWLGLTWMNYAHFNPALDRNLNTPCCCMTTPFAWMSNPSLPGDRVCGDLAHWLLISGQQGLKVRSSSSCPNVDLGEWVHHWLHVGILGTQMSGPPLPRPRHWEPESLGMRNWHPYFKTAIQMILAQSLESWCLGTRGAENTHHELYVCIYVCMYLIFKATSELNCFKMSPLGLQQCYPQEG